MLCDCSGEDWPILLVNEPWLLKTGAKQMHRQHCALVPSPASLHCLACSAPALMLGNEQVTQLLMPHLAWLAPS